MGMMSINVLERSKEIGVLRSIGATNLSITLIHWGESIIIILASYLLALPLSIPISRNMTRLVGMAFIQTPLDFAYAYEGLLYWLGIVLLVGTLASTLPTYHAMHMSIRECLSYE